MIKKYILFVLFSPVIMLYFQPDESVKRMHEPSVSHPITKKIPHIIHFNDTLFNDTLLEYSSADNLPVMYSRKVVTAVCIKGECRLVRIELFWDCTGRYLGFELPPGEFLSKTEHVKFVPSEYDRLHKLLSDPLSALANYALSDLVIVKDSTKQKVDAKSSATIAAVLDYIVEGAVYTTYTLWHIVYGQTRREVEKLTSEKLNEQMALMILESKNLEDQIWALNHISEKVELTPPLQDKLIQYINSDDIYMAERSLNAIRAEALNEEIQNRIMQLFSDAGFLKQRFILQKFKDAPELSNATTLSLSQNIQTLQGALVKLALELLDVKKIDEEIVNNNISVLLKSENRYVSNLAYKFLETRSQIDKKTLKSIEKYKRSS